VFADLKLFDIPNTLTTDGVFLREFSPDLLTVVCAAGVDAMHALQTELPGTEVLGVTVLTSLKEDDVFAMFSCSTEEAVLRLARFAETAGLGGFVCSPAEAQMLSEKIETLMSINTPAIRPAWSIVKGDDQNLDRIMTIENAIRAGARRLVIGRPITEARNRFEAVTRSIEEIASVF
jgi:orotidine-5'-phosphate decarboxylase